MTDTKTDTDTVRTEVDRGSDKLTLLPLVALVVGSMIGGGVFNLPSDMSRTGLARRIIIGWAITGVGMLMLAFVYQGLAMRKPALNAGPYAYAKAGFGPFIGFNSAWGYWLSAWLGNVSYAVAIFSALSYFFPSSAREITCHRSSAPRSALWLIHGLVLNGVKQAAFVNVVTTVAKIVPLVVFGSSRIVAFNCDKFTLRLLGQRRRRQRRARSSHQMKSTMLVTLWVFIGIEGASGLFGARAPSAPMSAGRR